CDVDAISRPLPLDQPRICAWTGARDEAEHVALDRAGGAFLRVAAVGRGRWKRGGRRQVTEQLRFEPPHQAPFVVSAFAGGDRRERRDERGERVGSEVAAERGRR